MTYFYSLRTNKKSYIFRFILTSDGKPADVHLILNGGNLGSNVVTSSSRVLSSAPRSTHLVRQCKSRGCHIAIVGGLHEQFRAFEAYCAGLATRLRYLYRLKKSIFPCALGKTPATSRLSSRRCAPRTVFIESWNKEFERFKVLLRILPV